MEEIIKLGDIETFKDEYSNKSPDEYETINLIIQAFEYDQLEIFKFLVAKCQLNRVHFYEARDEKKLELIHLISKNNLYFDEFTKAFNKSDGYFISLITIHIQKYGTDQIFLSNVLESENITTWNKGLFIRNLFRKDFEVDINLDLNLVSWCLDNYYHCFENYILGTPHVSLFWKFYYCMSLDKFVLLTQYATKQMMNHSINECLRERAIDKLKYLIENNLIEEIYLDQHLESLLRAQHPMDALEFKKILEMLIANDINISLKNDIKNNPFWNIAEIVDILKDNNIF